MLERLRQAGHEPVDFAELHVGGIDFPAVVSELELNGYAIERVHDHGRLSDERLLRPEPREARAAHPRWRHLAGPIASRYTRRDSRTSPRL